MLAGYQRLEPNDRGHYPIDLMGVELGVWFGSYQNQTQHSLRWWDSQGNLLLIGSEPDWKACTPKLNANGPTLNENRQLDRSKPNGMRFPSFWEWV